MLLTALQTYFSTELKEVTKEDFLVEADRWGELFHLTSKLELSGKIEYHECPTLLPLQP